MFRTIGYTEQSQAPKFDKIDKFTRGIPNTIDFFYELGYNNFCTKQKIYDFT